MRRGLRHGAPVVPAFKRAEDMAKANPTMSSRAIADAAGVSQRTAARAKQSVEPHSSPDDWPTIDKPPKGNLGTIRMIVTMRATSLRNGSSARTEKLPGDEAAVEKGELSLICAC
jgi:hypothetical protein